MVGVSLVILVKRLLAHRAWANEEAWRTGVAQLDQRSAIVLDRAKLQVRVVQLAENLVGRLRHLDLHGQQAFFLVAERVRAIAEQTFQQEPVGGQTLVGQELLHAIGRDGQDLGPDIAGGLGRLAGGSCSGRMRWAALSVVSSLVRRKA